MGNRKTAVFGKQKTLQIEAKIAKIATLNGNHVQSLFKSFFVQSQSPNFDPKATRLSPHAKAPWKKIVYTNALGMGSEHRGQFSLSLAFASGIFFHLRFWKEFWTKMEPQMESKSLGKSLWTPCSSDAHLQYRFRIVIACFAGLHIVSRKSKTR